MLVWMENETLKSAVILPVYQGLVFGSRVSDGHGELIVQEYHQQKQTNPQIDEKQKGVKMYRRFVNATFSKMLLMV